MTEIQEFRFVYCAWRKCSVEKYGRKLFWRALPLWARPWAWLIFRFNPDFFTLDFRLLDEVGRVCDASELGLAIEAFRDDCRLNRSFVHEKLHIRISGRRLADIYRQTQQLPLPSS